MTNILSLVFLLFLAAACLIYFVLPRTVRSPWLLCCSYLFYLYDPQNAGFLALLAGVTLVTYAAGLGISFVKQRWKKRLILGVCAAGCIGLFVWFKYARILQETFGNWFSGGSSLSFAVPLGISYFLFMATGYLIDIYRGKIKPEYRLFDYALFVSFFPLMTAGPIERADHLLPQFKKPQPFDYQRFCGGMFRILWGFFKKLVIADTIGGIVGQVYGNLYYEAYTGPVVLIASLLFSLQLYYDFSACSDIAVGAGQLFGIDLTENFKRPFAASSFSDLWRRWHISLTSWLRDYVYISLGGNRCGAVRTALNQIITFALSGLWHGGTLPYLVWGILNGVYLCVGKQTARFRRRLGTYNPLYQSSFVRRCVHFCVNYLLFSSCLVFFLVGLYNTQPGALQDAFFVYRHIFTGWDALFTNSEAFFSTMESIGFSSNAIFALFAGVILVEGLEYFEIPMHQLIRKVPIFLRWPLYYALCLGILFFGSFGKSGFIYQNY